MSKATKFQAIIWLLGFICLCKCDTPDDYAVTELPEQEYSTRCKPVDAYCSSDRDCYGFDRGETYCDRMASKCRCNDAFIPVEPGEDVFCDKVCVPIRNEVGDPCELAAQCREGELGEGSDCVPSQDDPSTLSCNCSLGSFLEPGKHKCYQYRSLLGESCDVDAQCTLNLGKGSLCDGIKKCACAPAAIPNPSKEKCLVVQDEFGGECEFSEECQYGAIGNLSVCVLSTGNSGIKICTCSNEGVNEVGENLCRRKAVSVGDPCVRNVQCRANLGMLSECSFGTETCVCTPFYAVPNLLGDNCLPIVDVIGGACEERQQCTSGTPGYHSDCMDSQDNPGVKVCQCRNGAETLPGEHECISPIVFIGHPCESDEQCAGEPGVSSGCSVASGLCRCLGGYVPSGSMDNCLPVRNQLGDDCQEPEQCQRGVPGPHSTCYGDINSCNCTLLSVNEPGQHVCHRKANLVGDQCLVNAQCQANLGELSHCIGDKCECKRNAIPSEDKSRCIANFV